MSIDFVWSSKFWVNDPFGVSLSTFLSVKNDDKKSPGPSSSAQINH